MSASTSRDLLLQRDPVEPVRGLIIAALGMVPWAGNTLQFVLQDRWEDPAYRRLRDFVVALAEEVEDLVRVDQALAERVLARQETGPLLLRAMEAAQKSIGDEKMRALRDATLHGVFERIYPFDLTSMVFELLERLTSGHLAILHEIRKIKHNTMHWPTVGAISMLNVPLLDTDEGMRNPQLTVFEPPKYFDRYLCTINTLIADDLINMGLCERQLLRERTIDDLDEHPTRLEPQHIALTIKGSLFFDVLDNTDGPKDPSHAPS